MSDTSLREHVQGTYVALRIGLIVVGAALPWLLWIGGALAGHALQESMSAYYHTPMRNLFVGALTAIGLSLGLYKGYSRQEDWVLNAAAVLAVCVAFLPTNLPCPAGQPCPPTLSTAPWHKAAAVLFFFCIAYVCIRCASDTLSLIKDSKEAKRLKQRYMTIGNLMIALPIGTLVMGYLGRRRGWEFPVTFFLEATAISVFAAYWLQKSLEIRRTQADQLAMEGRLQRRRTEPPPEAEQPPGKVLVSAPSESELAEAMAAHPELGRHRTVSGGHG
jgi:hypothetical protein